MSQMDASRLSTSSAPQRLYPGWIALAVAYAAGCLIFSLLLPADVAERIHWARGFVDVMAEWVPHVESLLDAHVSSPEALAFYYGVLWLTVPPLMIAIWFSFEPGGYVDAYKRGRYGPMAYKLVLGFGVMILLFWYLLWFPIILERGARYWGLNEHAVLRGIWTPIVMLGMATTVTGAARALTDFVVWWRRGFP